jgi:LPS sulfotransferase NodH
VGKAQHVRLGLLLLLLWSARTGRSEVLEKLSPEEAAITRAAYRDFAIVCHQRSGSHLLATALDGHAEITCQGELLLRHVPRKWKATPLRQPVGISGAIIMYNQWEDAEKSRLVPKRIIHLLRDPVATGISNARNNVTFREDNHFSHAPRGSGRKQANIHTEAEALRWTETVAAKQALFRERFRGTPTLEVTYEEMTGNVDIEELPAEVSTRILRFLCVRDCDVPLRPATEKTS